MTSFLRSRSPDSPEQKKADKKRLANFSAVLFLLYLVLSIWLTGYSWNSIDFGRLGLGGFFHAIAVLLIPVLGFLAWSITVVFATLLYRCRLKVWFACFVSVLLGPPTAVLVLMAIVSWYLG